MLRIAQLAVPMLAVALSGALAPAALSSSIPPDTFRYAVQTKSTLNALRACYDAARERDPEARGRVVVRYTVSIDGSVRDVHVPESALDTEANACIIAVFTSIQYRLRLSEPARVIYPLIFTPPDA